LLIDIAEASIIGISTAMVIEHLIQTARLKGSTVKLICPNNVNPELRQLGILELIGPENKIQNIE